MLNSIGKQVWHTKHSFKGKLACLIYANELVIYSNGKYWA